MEGKKKDVKAGVVQTVQNVVNASAKRSPSVGVPCMLLLVVLRAFFLKACGIPLHGRSSGQLLPLQRHRVDPQSLPARWTTSTSPSSISERVCLSFAWQVNRNDMDSGRCHSGVQGLAEAEAGLRQASNLCFVLQQRVWRDVSKKICIDKIVSWLVGLCRFWLEIGDLASPNN